MGTIIAYCINDGPVNVMEDPDGNIMVFAHRDEAIDYAEKNPLFQSGQAYFQIIKLDEL